MDTNSFLDECLKISGTIRFVGIYNNGQLESKTRKGMITLLTSDETEKSCIQSLLRFRSRLTLSEKLGMPIWSLTQYNKIFRLTIPIDQQTLILVSMDISDSFMSICNQLLDKSKNLV